MPRFQAEDPDRWEPDPSGTRLARTAGATPDGLFTAHLSASEYMLLAEVGFEPLGYVSGSSIRTTGFPVPRPCPGFQEIPEGTQAVDAGREAALSRMRAEADYLGADGVVGVTLDPPLVSVSGSLARIVAAGTAVRASGRPGGYRAPDGGAFTSALAAQDLFRLLATGAVPVAFVYGSCVYVLPRHGPGGRPDPDGERALATRCDYEARDSALSRMQAKGARAGAAGILGVAVTSDRVFPHADDRHAVEYLATGTAIRRLADEYQPPGTTPSPAFTLGLDI